MGAMTKAISTVKNELRLRDWESQVQECSSSGMSVVQWCALKGIPASTYYNRLRRLRETAIEGIGTGTVAEVIPQSVVQIGSTKAASDKIEISCKEMQIVIPTNIDIEALTAMLTVLKNA